MQTNNVYIRHEAQRSTVMIVNNTAPCTARDKEENVALCQEINLPVATSWHKRLFYTSQVGNRPFQICFTFVILPPES